MYGSPVNGFESRANLLTKTTRKYGSKFVRDSDSNMTQLLVLVAVSEHNDDSSVGEYETIVWITE